MKRNFWPYAIIAYFVIFIAGVVSWIVFAVHHDDQLVRPDYYEHEIRFQQQIDRVARTAALRASVQIAYHPSDQTISLALPIDNPRESGTGTIQLYRPSDARLDREIKLSLDEHGSQTISVADLPPGLWKVHISWSTAGNDYYFDQPVVLATSQKNAGTKSELGMVKRGSGRAFHLGNVGRKGSAAASPNLPLSD